MLDNPALSKMLDMLQILWILNEDEIRFYTKIHFSINSHWAGRLEETYFTGMEKFENWVTRENKALLVPETRDSQWILCVNKTVLKTWILSFNAGRN